jgi:hypothetical protein
LALEDEICRWSLNFICDCLCNSSRLGNAIANFGILYGRNDSPLGHNAYLCANKFNVNVRDIDSRAKVRCALDRYVEEKAVDQQLQVAGFLREVLLLRDDRLALSNNVNFTRDEIETIINELCTN